MDLSSNKKLEDFACHHPQTTALTPLMPAMALLQIYKGLMDPMTKVTSVLPHHLQLQPRHVHRDLVLLGWQRSIIVLLLPLLLVIHQHLPSLSILGDQSLILSHQPCHLKTMSRLMGGINNLVLLSHLLHHNLSLKDVSCLSSDGSSSDDCRRNVFADAAARELLHLQASMSV